MPTLYATDRSKASDHAIFVWRELSIPPERVAQLLPGAAERAQSKLELVTPAVPGRSSTTPIELILRPSRDAAEWWVELRLSTDASPATFFDGAIRVHASAHRRSEMLLVGRLTFPRELFAGIAERAMQEIAEDNVVRVFENLLLELESAAAAPVDLLAHAHRRHR